MINKKILYRQVQSLMHKAENDILNAYRTKQKELLKLIQDSSFEETVVSKEDLLKAKDHLINGKNALDKAGCVIADDVQESIDQIQHQIDLTKEEPDINLDRFSLDPSPDINIDLKQVR